MSLHFAFPKTVNVVRNKSSLPLYSLLRFPIPSWFSGNLIFEKKVKPLTHKFDEFYIKRVHSLSSEQTGLISVGDESGESSHSKKPHTSVLLSEILEQFQSINVKVYVDGTLGAAGHAEAILNAHPEMVTLVGMDVDPRAHSLARPLLSQSHRHPPLDLHIVRANFREVSSVLQAVSAGMQTGGVDAMLLDLGVSSMQIDTASRGFSFMADGPVDMRMDPEAHLQAYQVVNEWPESELERIVRDYGEERRWRQIAHRIVDARPIESTAALVEAIGRGGSGPRGSRKGGRKEIHPATRTFQALRIAVNDELAAIEQIIPAAIESLAPGGRLGIISFHSLEDRIVKNAFRDAAGKSNTADIKPHLRYMQPEILPEPKVRILTKKPIVATQEEIDRNPRSRSAKLRFIEKI
mmetsp:Transcript_29949/g.41467  ORF Transcript_29949/g.41467 Transcript_29949/m.41467 type:complete len:408 (-) Transcript_29949:138-1361(-)|eukprot:CAMPEP_0196586198 /NCGR_PEP_ID=MMETSP1081-20130531/53476_1 /TAXON_ID=36882 /ORGANISM="Pyramimonas amylifera, Strain CCMP720" /LENGTH=407 /DNA_ID=CAMNT_0041907997 /DNA_START=83 /DNA_END=1306 /DNA_ORIENTATION=+